MTGEVERQNTFDAHASPPHYPEAAAESRAGVSAAARPRVEEAGRRAAAAPGLKRPVSSLRTPARRSHPQA